MFGISCLRWADVRRDSPAVQGGISEQSTLCRDSNSRISYNSLGLSLRYVVLACGCFPDSRCYHVEIPEMAVLGGDGSVCLCLCGGAYNLYRLLNREKWK